ncbi:Uncharacterised protein [uncultured archaeon]|nr:Uncharacterised protein [uncultured archaeon]
MKDDTMIKLKVAIVSRKTSSIHRTVKGGVASPGAVWESVELMNIEELVPLEESIQVANVSGKVFLCNEPVKLMINDPALFGTFKAGDIVTLRVIARTCEKCGLPRVEIVTNNDPRCQCTEYRSNA